MVGDISTGGFSILICKMQINRVKETERIAEWMTEDVRGELPPTDNAIKRWYKTMLIVVPYCVMNIITWRNNDTLTYSFVACDLR